MIESLDVNETEARIFHVSHDKKRDCRSAAESHHMDQAAESRCRHAEARK
jgi:hypothetical protein